MSGWDDLEAEAKADSRSGGGGCGVGLMLADVEKEHGKQAADSILRTLANHRLSAASIHRALQKRIDRDILPSAWVLRNHRARRCTCEE